MELTQAQLNSLQTLTVNAGKIKADNLVVGQEIQVKVVAVNVESGEVTLKVNDALVTAKLAAAKALLQLVTGQTLKVTVAQNNANKVILQLPSTLIDASTQQKALREALPKQQPITDAIIQLKALINSSASLKLPSNIIALTKNFVDKLPTPEQLSTPAGVKEAIKQSGIFLENKLPKILNINANNAAKNNGNNNNINSNNAKATNTIDGDIKALLLGLKSALLNAKKAAVTQAIDPPKNSQLPLTTSTVKTDSSINSLAKQVSTNFTAIKALNSDQLIPSKISTPLPQEIARSAKLTETRTIEAKITEALLNTTSINNNAEIKINPDKQLTDKQIQQILSNLLGQKKDQKTSPQNTALPTRTGGLAPPSDTQISSPTTAAGQKSIQQYAGKENLTTRNEVAMAAIKSQNISEASAPRISSLVDLIETLIKQIDSGISRIQVHQLNTLQDQETNKLVLSLEIPVNDDDDLHLVQLEIEKEQNQENETETVMTVNLAMDLNEIGPVYARITIINDKTSVVLWAERDDTFRLVEESVDVLHLKLESAGLKSDGIACHHGQPPKSRFVKAEINNGLVDERA